MEAGEWASCPYEPAHRVPRARLQRHLVKCAARHPALAVCPYNATHRMPPPQLAAHAVACPARLALRPATPPGACAALTTPTPTLLRDFLPPGDPDRELWDD
ncbi:protein D7-like [Pararge aegeria]|uniref:protein D7-like n=1 Tax=Pararge aegeria TaxID=116150 RepID=UPI0019D2E128|nr:protein D7-like [Pararge aegeria]XP_039760671.1 protein D7-like [Pararge aegeria]XP_039760672.1 protein D7-like [Pararge aegeria]XP_039760673.1 protein D7-like [Pararge aegeria]XP_039760674.1 protein D7-like [Pararge aegeria]